MDLGSGGIVSNCDSGHNMADGDGKKEKLRRCRDGENENNGWSGSRDL